MRPKISFLIITLIFLASALSATLLLFYLDVESNPPIAISTMATAVFLALASFLSLVIYAFKKIYYRGEVNPSVIHSSVRQAALVSMGVIGIIALYSLSLLTYRTGGLFAFVLVLFELMIESIAKE